MVVIFLNPFKLDGNPFLFHKYRLLITVKASLTARSSFILHCTISCNCNLSRDQSKNQKISTVFSSSLACHMQINCVVYIRSCMDMHRRKKSTIAAKHHQARDCNILTMLFLFFMYVYPSCTTSKSYLLRDWRLWSYCINSKSDAIQD